MRVAEDRFIDLAEAGARVGYSPEYLRKMRNPPPMRKRRVSTPTGARWLWFVEVSALDEWAARRDQEAAAS